MTKANAKRRGRPRNPGMRDEHDRLLRQSQREEREAAILPMLEARGRAVGIWPAPLRRALGEPDDVWTARQAARAAMIRASYAYLAQPWMGSACGRMLRGESDVSDLWAVVQLVLGRHQAYQRALDAPRASADVLAKVQFEEGYAMGVLVADDASTDCRTYDERSTDAIQAWQWLTARAEWPRLFEVIDDCPSLGFIAWLRSLGEMVRGG